MADKPIHNVLLIAGPGGLAYDNKIVSLMADGLRAQGASVTVVGNGVDAVSMTDIAQAASRIKGPLTVFVHAHGTVQNDAHLLNLSGEFDTETGVLLRTIQTATGNHQTDYFMTSCHGSAAQSVAQQILPKGSHFVTLAPGSEEVSGFDVANFARSLPQSKNYAGNLSASNMLNDYLMTDLENRITPDIITVGESNTPLIATLLTHEGKPFTQGEKNTVYSTLKNFDREQVDRIMDKIGKAKNEWDIPAADYGAALAVAHAAGIQLTQTKAELPTSSRTFSKPSTPTERTL